MGIKIEGSGKSKSITALKKELEKSGGTGNAWIKNVPADGIRVRFLTEPEEWYAYKEHYDRSAHYFPCIGKSNGCPGCNAHSDEQQRKSRRWLANAVDVENDRVIPLKLPYTLVQRLIVRFERHGETIRDRDYSLYKVGQGLDTDYDVSEESKEDFPFSKYTLLDLEQVLIDRYEEAFGEEDFEEESSDDALPVTKKRERNKGEVVTTNNETLPWDEDEDDDEDYLTEDDLKKMKAEELRALAVQIGAEVTPTMKKGDLITQIITTAGE